MNPCKPKELLPELSEKLNLPLDLLEDLTEFHWAHVHRCLTSLDYFHVMVPHLGTFSVKGDKIIQKELDKLEPMLRAIRRNIPRTPGKYSRYMKLEEKVSKLIKLREQYFEYLKNKKLNKQLRSEIRSEKDLERQRQNS